jgi:methionyl-tRNA formyltransferase
MVKATLRLAFFGTPAFAVPSLDAILRSPHRLVGVVTQPDRPRGRGQHTTEAPLKARAGAAGIPVLQPERLNDRAFLDRLAAWDADLGVVAAYGRILTEAVLATPRRGMINVHASLLPKYRGAAPVHRAIIAGETETGVTIMRVVKALDAGPILSRRSRPIGPDEPSDEVERDLARLGAELLLAALEDLALHREVEVPQEDSEATYAPRLIKEDGRLDWAAEARHVHDLIRGLHPWPHAYTFLDGVRLILLRSTVVDESATAGLAGAVVEASGDRLRVATGRGVVQIDELQAEGRRAMPARDFLAGHLIAAGARLRSTP